MDAIIELILRSQHVYQIIVLMYEMIEESFWNGINNGAHHCFRDPFSGPTCCKHSPTPPTTTTPSLTVIRGSSFWEMPYWIMSLPGEPAVPFLNNYFLFANTKPLQDTYVHTSSCHWAE